MNPFPKGLDRVLIMAENCPPIRLVVADGDLPPDQTRVLSPVALTQQLTFDADFHLGDERTGAGCLIWQTRYQRSACDSLSATPPWWTFWAAIEPSQVR